MKQYDLRNWTISEETEGLLFFAQRMDEILFDYTVDSYKGRMLNSFMHLIVADRRNREFLDFKFAGSDQHRSFRHLCHDYT